MSNLFDYKSVRNHVTKEGFDLSRRFAATAKSGELLPFCTIITLPNSKYKVRWQHFTRTAPVQSAAFVRIREYFDWFYAPFRLFWKQFMPMSTQMENNPVQAQSFMVNKGVSEDLPYFNLTDLCNAALTLKNAPEPYNTFGMERGALWAKLSSYMGYYKHPMMVKDGYDNNTTPTIKSTFPVNIMPIALYHKLYNDYFRNQQWEVASPYLWNFDYSSGGQITMPAGNDGYWYNKTFFDMEYSNWNKDLFMGVLPNSQYGDVAEVATLLSSPVPVNIPAIELSGPGVNLQTTTNPASILAMPNGSIGASQGVLQRSGAFSSAGETLVTEQISGATRPSSTYIDASYLSASFSILALRQQQFAQRWKEIVQSGDQDYQAQLSKIWGVKISAKLSDKCQWVAGDASNIDISEVINTNFSDAYNDDGAPASAPYIKGRGVGVGESGFTFNSDEFGVLMCVYHCQPLLDYDINNTDLQLAAVNVMDFPNPVFDRIGFEELPYYALTNSSFFNNENSDSPNIDGDFTNGTIGYVPRYVAWKTAIDRVSGDFSFTLKDWVAPLTDEYFAKFADTINSDGSYVVNQNFFKVNPSALDNIFGVAADAYVTSDQFRINAYFDIKAVEPLDYNGLPY